MNLREMLETAEDAAVVLDNILVEGGSLEGAAEAAKMIRMVLDQRETIIDALQAGGNQLLTRRDEESITRGRILVALAKGLR